MLKPCSVYWIHLETHTDILSEGYVGVTVKKPAHRFQEHKRKASSGADLPISRAIRKYGSELVYDVILYGEESYCYEVEKRLRPSARTGWNIAIGGNSGGRSGQDVTSPEARARLSAARLGKKMSESSRELISKAQIGKTKSEETKLKISAALQGRKRGPYKTKAST